MFAGLGKKAPLLRAVLEPVLMPLEVVTDVFVEDGEHEAGEEPRNG